MQRGNGAVIGKQNTPTTSVATGVWALNEVQRAVLGGNWPASTIVDPYFENVSLLLHGNGTNGAQNNTFLDSSTNNFTITRNGNTTQGTFTPYGANWSNYFDGSGDYLRYATNTSSQFSLGTGDFTDEAWVFPTAFAGGSTVISIQTQTNVGAGNSYALYLDSTGRPGVLAAASSGGYAVNFLGTAIPLNTWTHLAVTRSGNTFTLWRNGVSDGTATSSVSITQDTTSGYGGWNIGGSPQTGQSHNGYISNARLVKGTAVYTAAFTPPTAPLTAITNTSLLTCADNRFIDNSSNNFTITRNGDVSVQRFSPFNPTAAYSAATIGGSGYFDGSGDWVQTPSSANLGLGTGNFTIEFWYYANSSQGSRTVLVGNSLGFTTNAWNIQINNASPSISNRLQLWAYNLNSSGIVIQGGTTLVPNTWYHVALVRNGNTFTFYLNGVSDGTATNTASLDGGGANSISVARDGTDYFAGYMTDVRILKGTAQYTSTFTPPTSPLTAITNTQLLTNFTNGGIFDNAMMNDLETVGNAQISTAQSKFGGGSILLNAASTYMTMRSSPNFAFGTGDFTLEMWAYFTSVANFPTITDSRASSASTAGFNLGLSSAKVQLYTTSQLAIGATTLSANTWYHIAICRAGSTLRIFVNGTQDASITNSTNWSDQTLIVGATPDFTNLMTGYIDDLRITKGYARYVSNFSVPTAPFPDQ